MTDDLKEAIKHLRRFTKDMRKHVRGDHDLWAKGYRKAAQEVDFAVSAIERGTPEDMRE